MGYKYIDGIGKIVSDNINIVDIISRSVQLKKAGSNLKGLCPFHSEKTPSFVVSEERQMYHCFGCGASGGAIKFVMDYENLDFITAIELICDYSGIDLTNYLNQENNFTRKDGTKYIELNRNVAKKFYKNLMQNNEAKSYLDKRSISISTIKKFGLGYAMNSWQDIFDLYKDKNDIDFEKTGLFIKGKNGHYDRFRNRIIFPIFDLRMRVIAFGGRTIDKNEKIKYINSPETIIYKKGEHLYALHEAKNHKSNFLILVEGYMDVIALYERGIKNSIASLGTALTPNQAKKIKKYTSKVIIIYDSDEAGIKATKRAIPILYKEDLFVGVLTLPGGLDPDDYINNNSKEKFLELIDKNVKDGYEYLIDDIIKDKDLKNTLERREVLNDIIELLKKIDKKSILDIYLEKSSKILNISKENLLEDLGLDLKADIIETEKEFKKSKLSTFISILLKDNSFVHRVLNDKYSIYLSEKHKQLIEYLIKNNGYDNNTATDKFSLVELVYLNKCYNNEVSDNDIKNAEVFYNDTLINDLNLEIKKIINTQNITTQAIEKIERLQKVIMTLYDKRR